MLISLSSIRLYNNDTNSQLHEQLHSDFWVDKSLIYNDFSASEVSVNLLVRGSIPRRGAKKHHRISSVVFFGLFH